VNRNAGEADTRRVTVISPFVEHARARPEQDALIVLHPRERAVTERVTYGELLQRAEAELAGLRHARLRPRRIVTVCGPLGAESSALALAALDSGRTLACLDPALDRRRALRVLRGLRPENVALVHVIPRGAGRARGIVHTHAGLLARHRARAAAGLLLPGDVALTSSWTDVLPNLAAGVTTVLAPEPLEPTAALEAAEAHDVSVWFGSPVAFARVAGHVRSSGEAPARLRQVVVRGTASRALCRELTRAFPEAIARVVYATAEADPIAQVTAREILHEPDTGTWRRPAGLLVGAPVEGVQVEVVSLPARLRDRVSEAWLVAQRAEFGEVIVRGPSVSRRHLGDRQAASRRLVRLPDGSVWQRTGDLARRDPAGRLRLLGRAGAAIPYRGGTLYPLPLEARLATVPGVLSAALAAVRGRPVIAAELADEAGLAALRGRLSELGLGEVEVRPRPLLAR
jgi:acyl-CoA synthetase (AMP-forming)/AMP-acid ligase II